MFDSGLRGAAQYQDQVLRKLRQMQGFFNEFRQPVFHADARTEIVDQNRALFRHTFHGGTHFAERREILAIGGLLAEAHEGGTEQTLLFGVRILGQLFANLADCRAHE